MHRENGELRFNQAERSWLRSARPWHPFAHIIRELNGRIQQSIDDLGLEAGQRLLDYGCADTPYSSMLPHGVEYVGADLTGNPLARVVLLPDGRVPVDDASFDAVLSTQVLEHVLDPAAYLTECVRVLRPGGRLLLSTHGTMVWHPDPGDYWRWTCEGLHRQIESSGLRVVSFEGVLGLAATGLQQFQDATYPYLPRLLRNPYALVLQTALWICDRMQSDESRRFNALVYVVVAERALNQ